MISLISPFPLKCVGGVRDSSIYGPRSDFAILLMTSLAFGFGVLPLALANGAGAGAQRAIGIGVVGGVISSTFLVTIFAPLFYVIIYSVLGRHRRQERTESAEKRSS